MQAKVKSDNAIIVVLRVEQSLENDARRRVYFIDVGGTLVHCDRNSHSMCWSSRVTICKMSRMSAIKVEQ